MKKLLKLVGWAAGLLVVALIAVVLWVSTIDPNDYKDWIANKVKEDTGRTVMLNGDLGLTIYPWLGVEVNDMTVSNAAGFGDEPFLHVDHFRFRAKFLPLLREQYEIDTVVLHGAVVNLARNDAGVTNWADLVKEADTEKKPAPLPLTAVVLGGVDVKDARINWSDQTTGAKYTISNVTAKTGELTYGAPINLTLGLDAAANQPALDGRFDMSGVVAYDLDAEKYSVKPLDLTGILRGKNVPGGETQISLSSAIEIDLDEETATVSGLKLSALGMDVAGELMASDIESPGPEVKTTLDVNGSDLALLFKVAEIEPLATQIAGLKDRAFKLKTTVDADLDRGDVDVQSLNAALLGATVNGEVKARNIRSDTPGYKGELTAAGPDLPALMLVVGQFQGGKDSAMSRAAAFAARAPVKAFSMKAGFDADLKSGDLEVPTLNLQLVGATIEGQVNAKNMHTDKPAFKGALKATGPDLPLLMQMAGQFQGKDAALATYGKELSDVGDQSFAVQAAFEGDMEEGNVNIPSLAVKTLGIDLAGNLKADDMRSKGGSIDGRLALNVPSAKGLLKALGKADLAEVAQSVKVNAGIKGTRTDLSVKPLDVNLVLSGKDIPNSPVTLALNADTRINLEAQDLQLEKFSLTGLGLNVSGKVDAKKIMDAPEFTGQINVAKFNMRQFLNQVKFKLPPMADQKALTSVALSSGFSGSKQSLGLSDMKLNLDGTEIKGDLSVKGFDKAKTVRFGVEAGEINADRYLPPERKKKKKKEPPTEIPVDLIKSLDVQGTLQVQTLTMFKALMRHVTVTVNGKDGKLTLDPMQAKLYQGDFDGDISIDVTQKLPRTVINAKLKGVDAERMLGHMTGDSKIKGIGDFSAALIAAGPNTDVMKQTLNGQMSFAFQNAALKGFNLGKIMRQGKSLKDSFTLKVSEKEETDFTEMTGNPVAKNGVITLNDLDGKSPGIRVTGKGVLANLPQNSVDYKVTATLVGTRKGQGGKDLDELEGVPLDCRFRGSLDAPKRNCDASKLLAAMGAKLIKGAVKLPGEAAGTAGDAAGKTLETGKELLKSIFD